MFARRLQFVVLVAVINMGGSRIALAAEDAAPQPGESGAVKVRVKPAEPSPEDVARRFFIALLTRDEAGIKRYSIPSPGSEILWRGAPIDETARALVEKRMAEMTFRRLKVGDTVTGPDGKSYIIAPEQVNAGRVILLPEEFKLPFTLVHSDLGWRVKVDWLIATRKAAAEARAEEQPEGSAKP